MAFPPVGGVTEPLNVPLDLLKVRESLLELWLITLLLVSMAMVFVKSAARLPPVKVTRALDRLRIALVVGGTKREPAMMDSLVKAPE